MPETMPNYKDAGKKQSFFGGSIFLKAILIIGLLIVLGAFLFAWFFGSVDLWKIITYVIALILGSFIIWLAIKGALLLWKKPDFSPTGSWREKIVRYAKKSKPFNVHRLYLRGEDMRTHSFWGKILGISFIPYVEAKFKKDKDGNPVYLKNPLTDEILTVKRTDKDGNETEVPIPDREIITQTDGDIVIVTPRHNSGLKALFSSEVDIIRANKKYVSDLLGDVYIKDVNLTPFGEYLYPSKQWQTEIIEIETHHKAEALVETYRQWLDLVSNVTQMSLASSPEFQKIMLVQAEKLATPGVNV